MPERKYDKFDILMVSAILNRAIREKRKRLVGAARVVLDYMYEHEEGKE